MHSYEDKMRSIELYLRYDRSSGLSPLCVSATCPHPRAHCGRMLRLSFELDCSVAYV